ncbi:MAG TPA: plastocyanin/azurin family copper-binding protein [Fodinibius sp.]|nr:plastocyanin/azurin family copper-binding protein [Fodinibius sp.]
MKLFGKMNKNMICTENKINTISLFEKILYEKRIIQLLQRVLIIFLFVGTNSIVSLAQDDIPTESDYYSIVDISIPDDIILEVGGMDLLPDGRLAVCTRRGEVWLIEDPYQADGEPEYQLFAEGLHEPLGLTYRDSSLYLAQRTEITRLTDTNGDEKADEYKTIWSRPVTGNYHEYFYGPLFTPDGDMLVTLNLAWTGKDMKSLSKWDGWLLKISPKGEVEPIATGLRSPSGFGYNAEGDLFYAGQQGGWVGSGSITHLEKGDFTQHPGGLRWASEPNSPISLRGKDIPDSGNPLFEVAKNISEMKTPSVWLPHGVMGTSTTDILLYNTNVNFGPFGNQLFVGDQGQSKVMRVFQEKVNGEYQGIVFPFKKGFESGITRINWGQDNSMFVGMTSRGWGSTGKELYGLQQLVWNGETPFEIKEVHAKPDGFNLTFTKSVDPETAGEPSSYGITSFTYHYHSSYGSDIINQEEAVITQVQVAEDGLSVRLVADNLREGYIHEIKAEGVRAAETGYPLLHPVGYYTLKNIPEGPGLALSGSGKKGKSKSRDHKTLNGEPHKHQTTQPESWTNGPDKTITINATDALTFDVTDFKVAAGSNVRMVLNNSTDLLHNLVVTRPGELEYVAKEALNMGLDGPKQDYVPQTDKVLFYTSLVKVGEVQSIYFTVPENPGDYPYVCTFPGHWQTMQGVMTVTE